MEGIRQVARVVRQMQGNEACPELLGRGDDAQRSDGKQPSNPDKNWSARQEYNYKIMPEDGDRKERIDLASRKTIQN